MKAFKKIGGHGIINYFKDQIFANFKLQEHLVIKDIPSDWAPFGLAGGDEWKKINVGKNVDATSIIYKAKKGTVFPIHKHAETESCIVLGKVNITTPYEDAIIENGECYLIDPDVLHKVDFLEDTTLILAFTPAFEGAWKATD